MWQVSRKILNQQMKYKNLIVKTLLLILFAILVFIGSCFGIGCIWKQLFNVYCPGCGMTRACIAALKFDFKTAFSYHPMFFSVPVLVLYYYFDGNLFRNKLLNRLVFILIATGFVINWIFGSKEILEIF